MLQILKVLGLVATAHAWIKVLEVSFKDYKNNKDFPCTLNQQFRIVKRKNKNVLDSTVWMRSNDIIYGFPYDVYFFTTIQKRLADHINCDIGEYNHYASSMHCYIDFKNHKKMLTEIAYE